MKLGAIFNVWEDCIELLPDAVYAMPAEKIIIIWSEYSNHGKKASTHDYAFGPEWWRDNHLDITLFQHEPNERLQPHANEIEKRNFGISKAKELECTHFIMCDADEFYIKEEFEKEKQRVERDDLNGIVCPLKVYISKPTLWCHDHTLVPAIQKLTPNLEMGSFKNYPFAYDSSGKAHIDPTRRTNVTHGIEMSSMYMHHMSYVRQNIDLKIDNSSANLRRSRQVIYDEMRDAKPGYVSKLYHQPLKESENIFNLHV